MPSFCCVTNCKKEYYRGCGLSFHRLPKDPFLAEEWKHTIPGSVTKYSIVCNDHFKEEDFIDQYKRRLKSTAVPSIFPKDVSTEDEDDNEKLSSLKKEKITQENEYISAEGSDNMNDSNSDDSDNDTMIKPCPKCSILDSQKKETSNAMTQTNIKSDREVALQAKVKLLGSRLKRRDAKIGYMKTVLNMIKKHTKGTDMAYKLCCELQNMSDFPDLKENKLKNKKGNIKNARVDSPARAEEVLSEEDTCIVFEVVSSPNLKT